MNLKSILKGVLPEGQRKVIFTEACHAAGQSYESGSEAVLPSREAELLIAEGRAIDPSERGRKEAEQKRLEALLPAKDSERPIPADWGDLPKQFAAWWKLAESRRVLAKYRDDVESALLRSRAPYIMDVDLRSAANIPQPARDKFITAAALAVEIGAPPAERLREIRYLEDALKDAKAALDAWHEQHGEKVTKLWIECGDHLQEITGEINRQITDLQGLAFEIHAARLSPMGYSQQGLRQEFLKSEVHETFCAIHRPSVQDLRLAYNDEGEARHYIDRATPAIASQVLARMQLAKEVAALLANARGQLKAALKAA